MKKTFFCLVLLVLTTSFASKIKVFYFKIKNKGKNKVVELYFKNTLLTKKNYNEKLKDIYKTWKIVTKSSDYFLFSYPNYFNDKTKKIIITLLIYKKVNKNQVDIMFNITLKDRIQTIYYDPITEYIQIKTNTTLEVFKLP